ncbi:MAG: mannose-1-phosphate guanylyltransferase/mannose-6-phosphate isomerase [Arenimonas sp.]
MSNVLPVLLCGGSGTRLWPLSREAYPKQFLPLAGKESLLQATCLRLRGLPGAESPLLISNEEHRFMVAEQCRQMEITPKAIMLEPAGRNTAPAIAVAALHAMESGQDPVLLVLPSDHILQDEAGFRAAVVAALPAAEAGGLITFGIVPTAPETGFGYIKASKGEGVRAVELFVEKPDQPTAESYLASGEYFWNSGMFMFRASRFIEELQRFAPEMLQYCKVAIASAKHDADFLRLDKDAFCACPADSIDYAVMEKTRHAMVLPIDVGWSDVGSWSALWQISNQDLDGNVHLGDVMAENCRNTFIWSGNRLISTLGLENMIVVDTEDALLVAHQGHVQDVKKIVARLKSEARPQAMHHRQVYRPWGSYTSIDTGERFQVKHIMVKPGAALSLQMHHHRAEHWVVVSGTARVTCDENVMTLSENQSTYIPLGSKHRLENIGELPLELIEVQSGSYLGEDDIVRFDDVYGRVNL